MLALVGGVIGLATAVGLLRALVALLPPDIVPFGGVALDMRVLLFTLAISIGTSLLFGMLPALADLPHGPGACVLGQRTVAGRAAAARDRC